MRGAAGILLVAFLAAPIVADASVAEAQQWSSSDPTRCVTTITFHPNRVDGVFAQVFPPTALGPNDCVTKKGEYDQEMNCSDTTPPFALDCNGLYLGELTTFTLEQDGHWTMLWHTCPRQPCSPPKTLGSGVVHANI